MTVDPLSSLASVQQLTSSLSDLGSQLSAAAPTGAFGAVLSQVNAEMSGLNGGGSAAAIGSAAGSALTGSGLLGDPPSADAPGSELVSAASFEGPTSGSAGGSSVVSDAQKYLGVPYQWGGTDPSTGLDCSGLVQRVYSDLGINVPRTSEEQATVGTPVASLADAQPGDLVFFGGNGYDGTPSSPGHVGIYIGNGQMIDAPHTGTDVRVDPVGSPTEIRRIIPSSTAGSPPPGSELSAASLTGAGSSAGMNQLGVPASLQPLFSAAGQRYGVDPLLLAAVAKQESGFQTNAVSGAGAQGLMQLMPATAAGLGVSALDPASAVDGAAQLLSGYLHDYGGSVPDALAAYNAGPGAVAAYHGVPPYSETEGYVSNITAMLSRADAAAGTGAQL